MNAISDDVIVVGAWRDRQKYLKKRRDIMKKDKRNARTKFKCKTLGFIHAIFVEIHLDQPSGDHMIE